MWARIQLREYTDQTTRQRSHSRSVIFALPHETVFSLAALLNLRDCHNATVVGKKSPKLFLG